MIILKLQTEDYETIAEVVRKADNKEQATKEQPENKGILD